MGFDHTSAVITEKLTVLIRENKYDSVCNGQSDIILADEMVVHFRVARVMLNTCNLIRRNIKSTLRFRHGFLVENNNSFHLPTKRKSYTFLNLRIEFRSILLYVHFLAEFFVFHVITISLGLR